jgi:hypothetical protein
MLVLRRSATPRRYRFAPLLSRTARFDEPVAIPDPAGAPIWARVRFKRPLAGRVASMLYKPPLVGIQVATRGGGQPSTYRLLPSLAEAHGFLLSPLIKDHAAYARLASETWGAELAPANVTTMTLFVDGTNAAALDPEFELELQRLELDR